MAGQRTGYVRVRTLNWNGKRKLEGQVLDNVFTDRPPARKLPSRSSRDSSGLPETVTPSFGFRRYSIARPPGLWRPGSPAYRRRLTIEHSRSGS